MTMIDLNVLPNGSYDILIGTEWLEKEEAHIKCLGKIVTFVYQYGKNHTI